MNFLRILPVGFAQFATLLIALLATEQPCRAYMDMPKEMAQAQGYFEKIERGVVPFDLLKVKDTLESLESINTEGWSNRERTELLLLESSFYGKWSEAKKSMSAGRSAFHALRDALELSPHYKKVIEAHAEVVSGFSERSWTTRKLIQATIKISIAEEARVAVHGLQYLEHQNELSIQGAQLLSQLAEFLD